jgi:hypothetical protein
MLSFWNNSAYEFGVQGSQGRPSFMYFGNGLENASVMGL